MKTQTTLRHKKTLCPTFPLIAVNHGSAAGLVVLFSDNHTGTVVDPGSSRYSVGKHQSGWVPVTDQVEWRILDPNESVTLRNDGPSKADVKVAIDIPTPEGWDTFFFVFDTTTQLQDQLRADGRLVVERLLIRPASVVESQFDYGVEDGTWGVLIPKVDGLGDEECFGQAVQNDNAIWIRYR